MPRTDRLTVRGFLARLAFALLVVGATYNPTRYSYYGWARTTGWQWSPPIVFVGVVLLAALFWLLADRGWLSIENVAAISWIGLFSVATILAVGMAWAYLRGDRSVTPS